MLQLHRFFFVIFAEASSTHMKLIFLYILLLTGSIEVFGMQDSVVVPISRQRFHDRIDNEQKITDKADGKIDGLIKVSTNEEVNLQVTDALTRRINEFQNFIEVTDKVKSSNEKIRQLGYIEELIRNFRLAWKAKRINPALASVVMDNFDAVWQAHLDSLSIEPALKESSYEVGMIIVDIFKLNPGYQDSKKMLFLKFCQLNPDKILTNIRPYVNEDFADSLVVIACKNDPEQLYDYAYSTRSPEGKLIQKNTNPMVRAIVQLSKLENALLYYPFLDNILNEKITIADIRKYIGTNNKGYDSVGYFKLLVKTEIEYYYRLAVKKDTPVAMFGVNGLRKMLQKKAFQHFIKPINDLHEVNNLQHKNTLSEEGGKKIKYGTRALFLDSPNKEIIS